jgi:APA family basic amino acid/polyamine antiporter
MKRIVFAGCLSLLIIALGVPVYYGWRWLEDRKAA